MVDVIFFAMNKEGIPQWVKGRQDTMFFRTSKHLKEEVDYHNAYHINDPWTMVKCRLSIAETYPEPLRADGLIGDYYPDEAEIAHVGYDAAQCGREK